MLDTPVTDVSTVNFQTPRTGAPFLDAFDAAHGPPSLLGRFFVQADAYLREHGLVLEFAEFDELVHVQAANQSSWPYIAPMFDARIANIVPGRSFCLVVRKPSREIIATMSGKIMDGRIRSLKQIVEDGEFVGIRQAPGVPETTTRITAPVAATLHGELLYNGGLWVHPDVRGLRLAAFMTRLVNGVSTSLWDPDYMLGMVAPEVVNTGLGKRYGTTRADSSVIVSKGGQPYYEGILIWLTREDSMIEIASFIEKFWPKIDSTVGASS